MPYNYHKYLISSSLKRLGCPIAAKNVLDIKSDFEMLKKYADQVIKTMSNSWSKEEQDYIKELFKELGLIEKDKKIEYKH